MSNPYANPNHGGQMPPQGQPHPVGPFGQPPQATAPKQTKPFYKRWWFIAIAVLVVLGAAMNMGDGSDTDTTASLAGDVPAAEAEAATGRDEATMVEADAEEAAPQETERETTASESVPREYRNALSKAETYVEMFHMSERRVYDQLTSEYGENFAPEAAQYAIDNLDVDWNEVALESAKSYQDTMAMSRDAIYDQLVSDYGEKFTPEQAQYAVDNLPE